MAVPVLLSALLLSAAAAAALADDKNPAPSFFNSKEVRSDNLKPFEKWTGALHRYTKEGAEAEKGGCEAKKMNACNFAQWTKFLDGLRDKDKMTQVKEVNSRMNGAKYITDDTNWGTTDYWATPFEFMAKFGDCEDYAISKFMSLKNLGFTDNDMRVVAVKDMNLKVGHAVLVVFVGGKSYLLDNQIKQVVETTTVRHYQPVFSINEHFWWRHVL